MEGLCEIPEVVKIAFKQRRESGSSGFRTPTRGKWGSPSGLDHQRQNRLRRAICDGFGRNIKVTGKDIEVDSVEFDVGGVVPAIKDQSAHRDPTRTVGPGGRPRTGCSFTPPTERSVGSMACAVSKCSDRTLGSGQSMPDARPAAVGEFSRTATTRGIDERPSARDLDLSVNCREGLVIIAAAVVLAALLQLIVFEAYSLERLATLGAILLGFGFVCFVFLGGWRSFLCLP